MKRKTVGIFVCILMIIVAFLPATGTSHNRELLNDKSTVEFAAGEIIVKLKKDSTFSKDTLIAFNWWRSARTSSCREVCVRSVHLRAANIEISMSSMAQDDTSAKLQAQRLEA